MNKLAIIAKRYSYVATAALLTLAMAAPAFLSASAGAEQLTERSVQISSSTPEATAVTYEVSFDVTDDTEAAGLQAVVLDFCASPINGAACTAPGGTFAFGSGVTVATTGTAFTGTWSVAAAAAEATALTVESTVAESVTAGDTITITITGFTNPTAEGTVYIRAYTFAATAGADVYTSETPGTFVDSGAVAFAIVPEIDVTAIVRETLTFCVAGGTALDPEVSSIDTTEDNCVAAAGGFTAPSVKLGDELETDVFVIDHDAIYTGNVFYQLNTNASNGTAINIKSMTASTGLTSGSNTIPAAATPTLMAAGTAAFGANVPDPGATPIDGTGLTRDANFSGVADTYSMPAAATGTYGAPLAANDGPVLGATGQIVFGATASANTPAGVYTGRYNLIAVPSY